MTADQPADQTSATQLIRLTGWQLLIRAQDARLRKQLADYFGPLISHDQQAIVAHLQQDNAPCLTLHLSASEQLTQLYALPFQDWQREPGKQGRKEAVYDLSPSDRLVHKVRTGLILWQHPTQLRAMGDLLAHPNQVINFILSQYLSWRLNQSAPNQSANQLGHCAALRYRNYGIAIAGFSGGGKSTLMLHLLREGDAFISNDRIVLQRMANQDQSAQPKLICYGIPKQPRVNPGTLLNNPALSGILPDPARYKALSEPALRALEEKYDVMVTKHFPNQPYQASTPLDLLIILDWQADATDPTRLVPLNIQAEPKYLSAIMKSAGPFYQNAQGLTPTQPQHPNPYDYLPLLQDCTMMRLTGKVDFQAAKATIDAYIAQHN
ncbi:HPr kinase [Thiomicrospira aerophila AL3]|uniref:HPr kinase n=1 Tax=Thiomicrospira aerophila AL3 TaxID=717772 RepID=W0DTR1_9GAMM|nr:HprK-related kinase B [Thiomicrospira aerophila]AHF01827.1 HPr kinase [Thiomicrospira aerophila AL3]